MWSVYLFDSTQETLSSDLEVYNAIALGRKPGMRDDIQIAQAPAGNEGKLLFYQIDLLN